jgi:formylglycine-generating enzyme required for sulfatase activity
MSKIQLLFAPENSGFAEKLATALAARGYEASAEAEPASAAVVVWSPASSKSPPILSAARTALARRVLVPVAVGRTPPPPSFEHLWPMDLAGWTGKEDDPRWRFVLDEIELATRRGVEISTKAANDQTPARPRVAESQPKPAAPKPAAPAPLAPAAQTPPASLADNDDFFEAPIAYQPATAPVAPPRPRLHLPRPLVYAGAALAIAGVAAAAYVAGRSADRKAEPAERPVVAFVQPKNQPADETDGLRDDPAASGADPGAIIVDVYAEDAAAAVPAPPVGVGLTPPAVEEPAPADEATKPPAEPSTAVAEAAPLAQLATLETNPAPLDSAINSISLPGAPEVISYPGATPAEPVEAAAPTTTAAVAEEADPIAELAWVSTSGAPADAAERVSFGRYFRDCVACPDMAELEAGSFTLGAPPTETGASAEEGPPTPVTIARRIGMAVKETTFEEWNACVADGGCAHRPYDNGWGRGKRPVINISWSDAQDYVAWLSNKTGARYRLPTEAEWEYAARAGSATPFAFGAAITASQANFNASLPYGAAAGLFRRMTTPTGNFAPNAFGLYDMHGNVWEWTADCWRVDHTGLGADGTAFGGDCTARIIKGGAWNTGGVRLRAADREGSPLGARRADIGFRVVRDFN